MDNPGLTPAVAASLDEILSARDARAERHAASIPPGEKQSLLALTVVVPGNVKRSVRSLTVAHAAVQAVLSVFGDDVVSCRQFDLPTGFEADFIIARKIPDTKRLAAHIEENHPLGRLFDLDVIAADGTPVSRNSLGMAERKCLCCDLPARYCMRAHTHSFEEVRARAESIVDEHILLTRKNLHL